MSDDTRTLDEKLLDDLEGSLDAAYESARGDWLDDRDGRDGYVGDQPVQMFLDIARCLDRLREYRQLRADLESGDLEAFAQHLSKSQMVYDDEAATQ